MGFEPPSAPSRSVFLVAGISGQSPVLGITPLLDPWAHAGISTLIRGEHGGGWHSADSRAEDSRCSATVNSVLFFAPLPATAGRLFSFYLLPAAERCCFHKTACYSPSSFPSRNSYVRPHCCTCKAWRKSPFTLLSTHQH